ncbi:unnamed protein product [Paramecium primaurelia]|uniref:Uncharacterized protein n=1 Tax=Paramecium primaurelia TaxID=5886 RepID=A0A8S1MVZ3_PARPR|nr:unnamed protein product [Paramecium primaurelia]
MLNQQISITNVFYKRQIIFSLASNNTHFFTLSQENEVFIYEWKNQIIHQINNLFLLILHLNTQIQIYFQVLKFYLIVTRIANYSFLQIIDTQPKIVNQSQSFLPISAKINTIVNGSNTFLIYAQYFQNYSILTLILDNLTIQVGTLINLMILILLQLQLSTLTQVMIKQQFTHIIFYENSKQYSQCDYIWYVIVKLTFLLYRCQLVFWV